MTEPAYTRGSKIDDSVEIGELVPGAGEYFIELLLYQNGTLQDAKYTSLAFE